MQYPPHLYASEISPTITINQHHNEENEKEGTVMTRKIAALPSQAITTAQAQFIKAAEIVQRIAQVQIEIEQCLLNWTKS
jgi:hypothetical protein